MFLSGPAQLEISAQRTLNDLHCRYGAAALTAAARFPAVSANLDQHAAAVRDILELGIEDSSRMPTSVLLAGYARGLLDEVRESATRPASEAALLPGLSDGAPTDIDGWTEADWLQLRMAAVCVQAEGLSR